MQQWQASLHWSDKNSKTKGSDQKEGGAPAGASMVGIPVRKCKSTQTSNDGIPSIFTKDWIVSHIKYKHLFSGIGRSKYDLITIEMKPDAKPVRKAARKVPLALKEKFTKEKQAMVDSGTLTKLMQNMPTPEWLNSIVVVKKSNGNLHVCLDPTDLKKSIIRPVCNMRTLEEITDKLKGSLYFAVFDSTELFLHVSIDEASCQLTAMLTPIGIYLYNVLAMGLSNTTDIFESYMRHIVDGLEGMINIADDVLVYAPNYNQFKTNFVSFLDKCVKHDLHLNPEKIRKNVNSIPFFGQTLTKKGLMMDEKKWKVMQEWPTPTNIKEIQLFLGSVNYLSEFIPFLSRHRKPFTRIVEGE